jgi:hypothetical protein
MFVAALFLQAALPAVGGAQLKWGISLTELVNGSRGTIQQISPTQMRFYGFELRPNRKAINFLFGIYLPR